MGDLAKDGWPTYPAGCVGPQREGLCGGGDGRCRWMIQDMPQQALFQ
jgi:hypothetical protein